MIFRHKNAESWSKIWSYIISAASVLLKKHNALKRGADCYWPINWSSIQVIGIRAQESQLQSELKENTRSHRQNAWKLYLSLLYFHFVLIIICSIYTQLKPNKFELAIINYYHHQQLSFAINNVRERALLRWRIERKTLFHSHNNKYVFVLLFELFFI